MKLKPGLILTSFPLYKIETDPVDRWEKIFCPPDILPTISWPTVRGSGRDQLLEEPDMTSCSSRRSRYGLETGSKYRPRSDWVNGRSVGRDRLLSSVGHDMVGGVTGGTQSRYLSGPPDVVHVLHTPLSWNQNTSTCFSIRQHTSTYVLTRPYTSAYVSIRKHHAQVTRTPFPGTLGYLGVRN